jgi:hypothetical protein
VPIANPNRLAWGGESSEIAPCGTLLNLIRWWRKRLWPRYPSITVSPREGTQEWLREIKNLVRARLAQKRPPPLTRRFS